MPSGNRNTIGFLLKGYPRLSETFIANEIALLEKSGFEIHIFALRNPGERIIHGQVRKINAGVTYLPDKFWPNILYFLSTNIRLWRRTPKNYWHAFKVAFSRSMRRQSVSTIKRFAQAGILVHDKLSSAPVQHFHAHFSHGPTTVAYFVKMLTGIPYSFSAHAKDIYLQGDIEFLTRKIWNAKFAVTCTEYNRRHLISIVGEAAPVFRVYHGIDLNMFSPHRKIHRTRKKPHILSVGRLVAKKGFATLLQALKIIREQGIEFECDIVGGGELRQELQAQIDRLNLQKNVHLHNEKSQQELLTFYQRADLFALACEVQTNGDRDGIPNVLVEAMATATPVVATRISGIPELITHGKTGMLVEPKNPEALAEMLISVLQNSSLRNAMRKAALQKVQQDFDHARNIKLIAEFLNAALSGENIGLVSTLVDVKRSSNSSVPGNTEAVLCEIE